MDQSLFGLAFIAVFALLIVGIKRAIVDKSIDKYRSRSVRTDTAMHSTLIVLFVFATIGLTYVAYQDALFISSIFTSTSTQSWLIGLAVMAGFVVTGIAIAPAILYVVVATKLEREQRLKNKILIYAKYVFMIAVVTHILLSLYLVVIY